MVISEYVYVLVGASVWRSSGAVTAAVMRRQCSGLRKTVDWFEVSLFFCCAGVVSIIDALQESSKST